MSKTSWNTFFWICLIVSLTVLHKFFIGMEKEDVFLFSDIPAYPSNIAEACVDMFSWIVVFCRMAQHRILPSRMLYPFIWLVVVQAIDYFVFRGVLGFWKIMLLIFLLWAYNRKQIFKSISKL